MSATPTYNSDDNKLLKPNTPKPYRYKGHSTYREYLSKTFAQRKMGHYITADTLNEAATALNEMEKNDVCITLVHHLCVMSVYNWKELDLQIKMWREKKCVALECNVMEINIQGWEGQGGKGYMMIIQPPDIKKCNVCPLALACGMIVNGYAYIFKNKEDVNFIIKALK